MEPIPSARRSITFVAIATRRMSNRYSFSRRALLNSGAAPVAYGSGMRLHQPRILPTVPTDWDDDSRPLLEAVERNSGRSMNIFRTLAHHPKLFKRWMVFGNHVLGGSTLPVRERELVILRTGFLCRSGYEWAQHVAIARRSGISDDEIVRLAGDPATADWSAGDRTLLLATDQLVVDHFVDDPTWAALREAWSEQQLMDLVFTVGQYTLVSMALNTFGVQLEPDTAQFPPSMFTNGRFPS
ncbi:MAG: Carboxymuconolactone decarboxylase family protein [Acidimicrobiales bacterium]|nr:Carboxymuconolactone decarboxylase family protein [Acidimicrobiales bacterium]